jgi:hypothetical protein
MGGGGSVGRNAHYRTPWQRSGWRFSKYPINAAALPVFVAFSVHLMAELVVVAEGRAADIGIAAADGLFNSRQGPLPTEQERVFL